MNSVIIFMFCNLASVGRYTSNLWLVLYYQSTGINLIKMTASGIFINECAKLVLNQLYLQEYKKAFIE